MNLNQTEIIKRVAETYKLAPAIVGAVIEVESSGDALVSVGNQMLPLIRWEGHYFDKYVSAGLQETARALNLAHPVAGRIRNPKLQSGRYALLDQAVKIDKEAAFRSISMGIGQVMGAHAEKLGFDDPMHMFNYNCQGYEQQVDTMMRYIVGFGLIDELQRYDFKAFARGYNGPKFAKGKYDIKLQEAFRRLSGFSAPAAVPGMLSMGSKGSEVRELQQLLVRAGYSIKVDGDFGPSTKETVMAFQTARQIAVDGIAGPETMKLLTEYRQPGEKLAVPDLSKVKDALVKGLGSSAVIVAGKTEVENAAKQIQGLGKGWLFDVLSNGLFSLAAILAALGIIVAGYQWYKANLK